jgi:hypothetical protein
MVQLQSASRLIIPAEFGTTADVENADGTLVPGGFKVKFKTYIGRWSLSTTSLLEESESASTKNFIIIVHHRANWDDVTAVKFQGNIYSIEAVNQDPFQNPTAYDQITIRKVDA